MTGIQYITNEKGEHVAVQIDLAMHGELLRDLLEDIDDLRIIEERKNEPCVPYDKVREDLIAAGKL